MVEKTRSGKIYRQQTYTLHISLSWTNKIKIINHTLLLSGTIAGVRIILKVEIQEMQPPRKLNGKEIQKTGNQKYSPIWNLEEKVGCRGLETVLCKNPLCHTLYLKMLLK